MITAASRKYVERSYRWDGECYTIVRSVDPAVRAVAYCQVAGRRERLFWRATPDAQDVPVSGPCYVVSPCFVGSFLVWSQGVGRDWQLSAARVDGESPSAVFEAVPTSGRPMAIAAAQAGDTWGMVWEERSGRSTKLRMARVDNDGFSAPLDLTDGSDNAYDPACCFTNGGEIAVVYSTFKQGQYSIELQLRSPDGTLRRKPQRLSNAPEPCLYPSVCPRPEGGVWFSYTAFDGISAKNDMALTRHARHRAQREFFSRPGEVYCGVCDADGRLLAPLTPPSLNFYQGFVAAMVVTGATEATRSHVFTGPDGSPHLLLRTHRELESLAFEQDDPAPPSAVADGVTRPGTQHPAIAITSLEGHRWTEPRAVIPRAHLDGPVSFAVDDAAVHLVFQQDCRRTGWSRTGEWFDNHGALAIGVAELRLTPTDSEPAELLPFVLSPVAQGGLEDPPHDKSRTDGFFPVFGQVHTHSNLSVCARSLDRDADLNVRFAQDVQHSDFIAITDHPYNMWQTEMLQVRKTAEFYYFPGEFVALQAYEWTGSHGLDHEGGPWGHLNPLSFEEDGDLEIYTPSDPDCVGGSLTRLWQAYADRPIVTIPHHVMDKAHPYNWDFFDQRFVPVIELFQDRRGSAEQPGVDGVTNSARTEDDCWALTQLRAGRRFGFIAGSDHSGTARAALWVRDLTRTELYDALMARRTYGSTGLAIRVEFSFNGRPMGTAVAAGSGAFELRVNSPEPLHELQLVRSGETVERIPVEGCAVTRQWTVKDREPGEFWYVRIVLQNGEMAWTSPIWRD